MDAVQRNRLQWKCRRGLLELDLVFERVLPTLRDEEMASLNALLDMPDNDLWEVVVGRSERYEANLKDIVARLRAA